ncbi:MAG: GIY-YIG nuclease family protein [Verrucomicrobiota bacterium]
MPADQSYQLHIQLTRPVTITVGRLGKFQFPAGQYIYTGSAKRNLEARIKRHLSKHKKLRWHIDYLLTHRDVRVSQVQRSAAAECAWNQKTCGKIIVPGFGASDCRHGCGSHLKLVSPSLPAFRGLH